jgi:ABC-type oligopeptide transport system ATPase subunit
MSEPLLSISHLVKSFPAAKGASGRTRAVDDVSFQLRRGEVLGVVGESGSGKSTTARCLVGLERPDSGEIRYDGADPRGGSRAERRRFRREVQMVFQDPYASLSPRLTVEQIVGEGVLVHRLRPSRAARRDQVVRVLELVGLDARALPRYPRSFSGGQRQRIAIARALAVEPTLLICDEPVSALDVSVQAQVINLLALMRRQLDLSILFIAHDLAIVRYLCDRVVVMESGRVVEQGACEQVYQRPAHDYTRALLAAVPIPDPARSRARAGRSPS